MDAPNIQGVDPGWISGVNRFVANPQPWNMYDGNIRDALKTYSGYLSNTPGYAAATSQLNLNLVKAMMWTETGAEVLVAGNKSHGIKPHYEIRPEWKTRPIQIGNIGDPALGSLLDGSDRAKLILPPAYRPHGSLPLTRANVRANASYNIPAGIGYLLLRHKKDAFLSVIDDKDKTFYSYTVKSGDSFAGLIAHKHRPPVPTTGHELVCDNRDYVTFQGITADQFCSDPTMNPFDQKTGTQLRLKPLRIGKSLNYQKASMQWKITAWTTITVNSIAARYNTKNPDEYAKKLNYCLWLMSGGKP